jgi:hypothetical protein
MTSNSQQEQRARLIERTRHTDARLREIVAPLDDERLRWTTGEDVWSIGQALEHLCVANDSYLDAIRPLVSAPDAPRAASDVPWKPTLIGRLMVSSFRSPRKIPTPRIYRVGPVIRPDVAREFFRREDELLALLDRAAPLDWRRIRMRSPVTPLVRLNLGDAFAILVEHTARHLGQIERLASHPEFPRLTSMPA